MPAKRIAPEPTRRRITGAERATTAPAASAPLVADTANHPPRAPADDPFFYGWRFIRSKASNGREKEDQVPLTLADILHPQEDDFRVHTQAHNDDCAYLKYVIASRLPPDGLVLSDCRVDWGVKGIRPHGPDVAAFRGVRKKPDWATFAVVEEKARPLFVIEITSPGTRNGDLVKKVKHYYRAGVPLYFIVDAYPETEDTRVLRLIGYRRGPTSYRSFKPDELGRFVLKPLGLLLGIEGRRACCYDAATGQKIGDYQAVVEQQKQAEERIRQLEAEIRRLRGES